MSLNVLAQGWSLLDQREKKQALIVLGAVIISAMSSALMVASIMPFLAALSAPEMSHDVGALAVAYDLGGFRTHYEFLVALGLASLVVIIASSLAQVLRVYLVVRFSTMRMHTLSVRLLSAYIRQPYSFFIRNNSGDLGTKILTETQQVVQNFFRPAAEAIAAALTILAIVTLLLWVSPVVAVTFLMLAGGIYVGAYAVSQNVVRAQGGNRAVANKDRFRVANEALSGIKDVKLLGRETSYLRAFCSASLNMASSEAAVGVVSQIPQFVMQAVAFGGMIILSLALLDSSNVEGGGALSAVIPMLGVFAFAGQRLIPELARLYQGVTQLNYGSSIVRAIYDDLLWEQRLGPLPTAEVEPMGLKRLLALREVSYRYENSPTAALEGVSLDIRAGERIGIVGSSGSGKTTLADVLMGLLEVDCGEIVVDGEVLSPENLPAWRRSVSYVQQDIFLSDASIIENIALGLSAEEIDRSRAEAAARMACLDEFVRGSLPEGYSTIIGERGVRISGGQRQRIGIARSLYNSADMIIFDEATSALDNMTERLVMESIDALPDNTTIVIIAHRLSTIRNCDRLVVMDGGRIVGVGTWEDLLTSNPHFVRLASMEVHGASESRACAS